MTTCENGNIFKESKVPLTGTGTRGKIFYVRFDNILKLFDPKQTGESFAAVNRLRPLERTATVTDSRCGGR